MQKLTRTYPIDDVLPRLLKTFQQTNNVVLSAPTGAGKTTRVPISLLTSEWMAEKKLIMLEPRRLAARRAAEYMAAQLSESVGQTVGYRIRGEAVVSKNTRIEVVTEGILTRFLQHESDLPNVALIIFDEFHERSIHADLGLALALDVQEHLRNDLRILVMSATLDGIAVAKLIGDAQIIESAGFLYPITTNYARFISDKTIETRIVDTVMRALTEHEGDVLAFLPGQREIRRVENSLWEKHLPKDVIVYSLYGDASYQQQSAALSPAPVGIRKIILSTSVAETSLTIDGVCIVIDSGLARTSRFDVRRGMSGLVTVPVSKAVADQRRGRAGRQQPGICYRLWTETEHAQLPDYPQPEIKTADLAPLILNLAQWGTPNGEHLKFLDPPPLPHLLQAQTLLKNLGALDSAGKLTKHGRVMAELPLHPRLSHMIIRGKELGLGSPACDIAALLDERDIFAGKKDADIDLESRLHVIWGKQKGDTGIQERILAQSKRLHKIADIHPLKEKKEHFAGILLALAYPERVARRRDTKRNAYQMASGTTGVLPKGNLLAREEFLAIGEVDGIGAEVRIYLATPLDKKDLQRVFADVIIEEEEIRWSSSDEAVIARNISRLGAIVISEQNIELRGEKVNTAMVEGIRQMGLDCLPWGKETQALRQRIQWLRKYSSTPEGFPDFSDAALLDSLENWLSPFLDNVWKKEHLVRLPLLTILKSQITYSLNQQIDSLAPSYFKLPSGSRVAIDYGSGNQPVLVVKLQELFGQKETPYIANGKVKILLHLLSPASRPLAVTQDLYSFWETVYPEIRKRMLARYPKHFWPEDPLTAKPTNRTVKRKSK